MDYGFEASDAVLGELAKVGFDPVYGARPLKRAIQSEIENPLAKAILEGRFAPKDTVRVDYRGGRRSEERRVGKKGSDTRTLADDKIEACYDNRNALRDYLSAI